MIWAGKIERNIYVNQEDFYLIYNLTYAMALVSFVFSSWTIDEHYIYITYVFHF